MVAGERPSFASEKQNFASGVPTAMSHAATSPVPPANAGPCTRAIVGLSRRSSAASMSAIAREMQEPQHVTRRQRSDECLLGVNRGRRGCGLGNVARRGAAGNGDAALEAPDVLAAVSLVLELALAGPFDRGAVLRHGHILKTPKRVFSIGALSAAEMASPSS